MTLNGYKSKFIMRYWCTWKEVRGVPRWKYAGDRHLVIIFFANKLDIESSPNFAYM